jgi:hypothetical protein
MNDDAPTADQSGPPASGPDSGSEARATDDRALSRRGRLLANAVLGLLVVAVSGLLVYFGDPGQRLRYATVLLASAPFLLGYRGTDAAPRPLAGFAAFGLGLLLFAPQLSVAPVAAATGWLTGMDPVSARFAVERGVGNAVLLVLLEGTLWAWLLLPAATALVRDPPAIVSGLSPSVVSPRGGAVALAVVLAAGTLPSAFLAGYHPVTTVGAPGETYERDGVAVTVTDVAQFDADTDVAQFDPDTPTCVSGDAGFCNTSVPGSGDLVLVHVRTRDRGQGSGDHIETVRLVTPAADGDDRVRSRVDTVRLPSGNPLFEGSEMPAERVRIDGRNYTVYDPDDRTGRTNEGWILFRRPPDVDAGSHIRIQTTSPGAAGKWPLPAAG